MGLVFSTHSWADRSRTGRLEPRPTQAWLRREEHVGSLAGGENGRGTVMRIESGVGKGSATAVLCVCVGNH